MRPNLVDRNAGLIGELADEYGVEPRAVRALIEVEAAGEGLCQGRPIVRLELHHLWLGVRPSLRPAVDARFHVGGPRAWEGHQFYRSPPTPGQWYPLHQQGQQGLEWEALTVARGIDDTVAIESTSWGCGQVMGQHWRALGHASPAAFIGAQDTEAGQLRTLFRQLRDVAGAVEDLRARRWSEVARRYNGAGQVEWYASRLAAAYERAA